MSMSKKDYQAIARAIYQAGAPICSAADGLGQCRRPFILLSGDVYGCAIHGIRDSIERDGDRVAEDIAEAVANVMAADSPRFDRARFIEACETGSTRGMKKVGA